MPTARVPRTAQRHVSRALGALAALMLVLGAITACGGTDDEAPPKPGRHAKFELSATFADPEVKPSRDFLDNVGALIDEKDNQEDLDDCPFGTPADFNTAIAIGTDETRPWQETTMAVGSRIGGHSSIFCNGGWLRTWVTKSVETPSIEAALEGVWEGTGSVFSQPQPFLGGQAFIYRYVNQTTEDAVVGVGWLYETYFVNWSVFVSEAPATQVIADWFSSVFPSMVGVTPHPAACGGGIADVDQRADAPLSAPGSVTAVAEALLPSIVQIGIGGNDPSAASAGAGWVLDHNGHIVTTDHVLPDLAQDGGTVTVVDHNGNRYGATVVGRSSIYNLAVLRTEGGQRLQPAKLGCSSTLQIGDPVVALGGPVGLASAVTSGTIRDLHHPITPGVGPSASSYIEALQTDAALGPGRSGGPLVTMKGEIVGITTTIATAGGSDSFAIPIKQIRVTVDQILTAGKAQRPSLGAQIQPAAPADGGATVGDITPGGPAEMAGLVSDDRVTHVNGTRVDDASSLIATLSTYQPGQIISLTVVRGSDERTLSLTLGSADG